MPSPNATFTELVTTTLRHTEMNITDNVSKNNALLNRLRKRGKIQTRSGGYSIQFPLEYAENSTYTRFNGYDTLNVNASDVLTSAEYAWCQIALHITASSRELMMNNSKEAMLNLVKARVNNAMNTAANQFTTDLYGSGSNANQIVGLGGMISTDGTGTIGGINASTYTWWKNKFQEMSGTNQYTGTTDLPTNIVAAMNKLWYAQVRGSDKPDLVVLTQDFYAGYESSLQQYARYTSQESADIGFQALKFKGIDVIFDDNATNFTTTGEIGYFLNTDYIYLVEHTMARWKADDDKVPVNQAAVVKPIFWMGALVCSNRSLQGRLLDAS